MGKFNLTRTLQGLTIINFGMGAFNLFNSIKNRNWHSRLDELIKQRELFRGQISDLQDVKIESLEQKAKSDRDKLVEDLTETMNNSNISEVIMKIVNNFHNFLETLSSLQLAALFNLMVDYLILSSAFTVLSLLIGDHLIETLKLNERYPRLANIIKLKSKMNKYYKTTYFIIHFCLILFSILGNLFFFFLKIFLS